MRNIFVEKSYTKCGGEAGPITFSENSKSCISLRQFTYSMFKWKYTNIC